MSHEYAVLQQFAEKISTYTLPFDAREELNEIKSQIEKYKDSPQALPILISHLSSFLHYLYLSLGSNAAFIEPLMVEMQSILFESEKQRYAEKSSSEKRVGSSSSIISLKGILPHSEIAIEFEEHFVKADGNCGFTTLGTDRKTLTQKLLLLENNAEDREFLAEEIINAFITYFATDEEDGLAPPEDKKLLWQEIQTEYEIAQKEFDQLFSKIQNGLPDMTVISQDDIDHSIAWLKNHDNSIEANMLQEKHLKILDSQNKLSLFCQEPVIFNYYINILSIEELNLWLGYKSAILYAKNANIALYIWRKNTKNKNQLELIDYHIGNNSNEIHMLHTAGFTHFNLLSKTSSQAIEQDYPPEVQVEDYIAKCKEKAPDKQMTPREERQILNQELRLQATKSLLPQKDNQADSSKIKLESILKEQRRLNKNIKFKHFLRKIWQYVMQQQMPCQRIFISYAWPIQDKYSERWTKNFIKSLSTHLCQAGIQVYLDEFHSGGGYPLRKFMQNIGNMDHVLVINTKTMREKLSLEHSGVKYEATQIKKHIGNKSHHFVINILLDEELHSDPAFHHYPQLSFLDENSKSPYYEILGDLLGKIYHFEKESLAAFKDFYTKTYSTAQIDADLWHVSIPSPFHIKRKALTEAIQHSEKPIMVLHGPSGSGKSELVRQYVWENYAQYQTVYWFDASSLESLKNDFVLLMQSKNLPIRIDIKDHVQFVECFTSWLKNQKNCLIVLDHWMIQDNHFIGQINANFPHEKNNKMIMTAVQTQQFEVLHQNHVHSIKVGNYTSKEAREYVDITLGYPKRDEVTDLLEIIGELPRELAHACGYIQRQAHSIPKFLSYYEKLGDKIFTRPLLPVPSQHPVVNSSSLHQEQIPDQQKESMIKINPVDQFLMLPQEKLSEIGKSAQLFLKILYDRFKKIDYQNHPILLRIFDHQMGLQNSSQQEISDEHLIKTIHFIVSHLNAIKPHFKTLDLADLVLMGEQLLKNHPLKLQKPLKSLDNKNSQKAEDAPAIVLETEDDISAEMMRYQEQNKLDQLTNNERSGYESAFKLFLNDLWVYALSQQCRSKKIYLFCALPDPSGDERGWMQSYIENLKKHLSHAGFSVYPEDITQSMQASDEDLNKMDHVIAISNPTMEERLKNPESLESQFDAKIHKIAQQKPERFRLPFLTGKVNHLDKRWKELAEFSFFKNDYLKEFQSLVRMLYGLDQIGKFNAHYQQRLLYHGIRDNQWHVPERTPHFIGRKTQLEKIKQEFKPGGQQVVVVTAAGMGGVGKTQLTLQYIHLHGHEYQKIYWIDATSEDSIKLAYAELAEHLKIQLTPEEEKSIDLKAERVKRALENKRGWLIVYDNAPHQETIEKFKPAQGGKILVTSRNTVWPNAVSVEVFTEAEAEKYMRLVLKNEILQKEPDLQKSLKGLMNISGRLPIALALICAYINKQKEITLEQYIARYEKEKNQLPAQQTIDQTMTVIWKITAAKIQEESPEAIKLINFCSLLHHEGIPEYLAKFFFEQFMEDADENSVIVDVAADEAKRVATEYSILKFDSEKNYFSLHFLVQEVIKTQLNVNKILIAYLSVAIEAMINTYPVSKSLQNEIVKIKRELWPHVQEILNNHDNNSNEINSKTDINYYKNHEFFILSVLCEFHASLGDFQKTINWISRIKDIKQNLYGENDSQIAKWTYYLSNNYFLLGDIQECEHSCRNALVVQEDCYGIDHPETKDTLGLLKLVYNFTGDIIKQKELNDRILTIKENWYESNTLLNNQDFMIENIDISISCFTTDKQEKKQKKQIEKSLPILENNCDKADISFVLFQMQYSLLCAHLGDMEQAEKLFKDYFPIVKNFFGKNHIFIVTILVGLGIACCNLENAQRSIRLLRRALAIVENHFRENKIFTMAIFQFLGNGYAYLGDIPQAVIFFNLALAHAEQNFGIDSLKVAELFTIRSKLYGNLGDVQKQIGLIKKALKIYEKHYRIDQEPFIICAALVKISILYGNLGNLQKQKKFLGRALQIRRNFHGENHYEVAQILIMQAGIYLKNDIQQSKKLFKRSLPILNEHYRKNPHEKPIDLLAVLGEIYLKLGKIDKSKYFFIRSLLMRENYYGKNHYKITPILITLGKIYLKEDMQESKKYLKRALPILKTCHKKKYNEKLICALSTLGLIYKKSGNIKKSKELLEQALEISEKHEGENHCEISSVLSMLGGIYQSLGDARKGIDFLRRAVDINRKYSLEDESTQITSELLLLMEESQSLETQILSLSQNESQIIEDITLEDDDDFKKAIELSLANEEMTENHQQNGSLIRQKSEENIVSNTYHRHGLLGESSNRLALAQTEKNQLILKLHKEIFNGDDTQKIKIDLSENNGLSIEYCGDQLDEESVVAFIEFFSSYEYETCEFNYPVFKIISHDEIKDFIDSSLRCNSYLLYAQEGLLEKSDKNNFTA